MVWWKLPVLACVAATMVGCDSDSVAPTPPPEPVTVRVTWTNPSVPGALGGADILIAPGVWAVKPPDEPLFELGAAATEGLERLAEDGQTDPMVLELVEFGLTDFGAFSIEKPGENYDANPIGPGDTIELTFEAMSDESLNVAAMFIHSNDVFIAPGPRGIELQGLQVGEVEDVTELLGLYDAGTEANEPPGVGPNQPIQQLEPNTGEPGEGVVSPLDDGFEYPAMGAFSRLTLERID